MAKPKTKTVSVKLNAASYQLAKEVLKARGTDVDVWINLQLRSFARTMGKNLYTLKDKMPAGKYMGEQIENIVRADLPYMVWMLGQDFKTKYDADVHRLVGELSNLDTDEFNQDIYG